MYLHVYFFISLLSANTCKISIQKPNVCGGSYKGNKLLVAFHMVSWTLYQCAKKVVSDSPGLVDFAMPGNFVLNLLMGKWNFLRNLNYRKTVKSILLIKMFLEQNQMTFGLVYASLSLPEWAALKMTFLAPWLHKDIPIRWNSWTPVCNSNIWVTLGLL